MVSHEHKFIFIHIPKTAGTSIEKTFGHFEVLTQSVQDHRSVRELEPLQRALPNCNSIENIFLLAKRSRDNIRGTINSNWILTNVNQQQFDSYFKFAFVRNPWSRVVSWYKNVLRDPLHQKEHGVKSDCTFDQFLKNHSKQWALRSQLFWLKNSRGEIGVDFVGRFERLEQDFSHISRIIGFNDLALPKILDGNIGDYANYYNHETKNIVQKLYAEEIEVLKYSFEN